MESGVWSQAHGMLRFESILRQVLSAFEIVSISFDTNFLSVHVLKESFLDCGVGI